MMRPIILAILTTVLTLNSWTANACPRNQVTVRTPSKTLGATDVSTLNVSISEDGIFRARVTLPESVSGSCSTVLYSRLRREDLSTGQKKALKLKAKVGRTVQFRASSMPGVSRSGDQAPALTFLAATYCVDTDLYIESDLVARFLDCGDPEQDLVVPSEFVKLLRRKLR